MDVTTPGPTVARTHLTLAGRCSVLALLLFLEKFALNFLIDFPAAQTATGFGAVIRVAQHWGFRLAVSFALALALFVFVRAGDALRTANAQSRDAPYRLGWAIAHLLLVLALMPLSYSLYGHHGLALSFAIIASAWLVLAVLAMVAAALALAPWSDWARAARALGALWFYSALAAIAGTLTMQWSQQLWVPTARLTFELVYGLLAPFIPSLQANPATQVLSTDRFAIEVSPLCSGLEGVGMMLAFCGAWLVYFRREYLFPRALVLLPAGLLLIFGLNVLRIAALMAIGYAGSPDVAVYGFHSQAGWIGFNCAAAGVAFVSRRSPWMNRLAREQSAPVVGENPVAAFLLPFLAILAAGTVAHAMSNGFETLYIMRPLACIAALIYYRPQLRRVDWRCSWRGAAVGAAVFAMWMLAARWLLPHAAMPVPLQQLTPAARSAWIAIRAFAAIVTVPIAEELAFRGFLMRRLVQAEFDVLPFGAVGLLALLISSIAFGLGHGAMWLPGILAGLAYGGIVRGTHRLGEAALAHAVTNAGVVVWVLIGGQWQLW